MNFTNIQQIFTIEGFISFSTLFLLELVLGIDNIVFISIIAEKLPKQKQNKARIIGLWLALIFRIMLLFLITLIIGLNQNLFSIGDINFSGRDLILLFGGLFLMAKSTTEIHTKIEGEEKKAEYDKKKNIFTLVVLQIIILDLVFSFDSILTAIGLVQNIAIMIIAVIASIIFMMLFSKVVSEFVNNHPTVKILALAFLLMIGVLLVVEAFDVHIPKGYVYFAMAFSLFVEMLNLKMRKRID
ncbi:MAG: TerC family protein [Bacteroidetes bacterium]|nr:TerC family protein [Bacteroidota bacterium]